MQQEAASSAYVPTSVHLATMLDRAAGGSVSVEWLLRQLGDRSFGLTLFVMGMLAFLPGVATIVALLIAWPAIQMILGYERAALPRLVARRQVSVARLARVIRFVTPRLEWLERLVRRRWPTPFQATKRATGVVMLLLGLTMISPVPLAQVVPALVIMLLALAYLEKDGVMLLLALFAALLSFSVSAAAVWGTIETVDWLDPVRPK